MAFQNKTVSELSRLLKAKEISAVELTTHFLKRIFSFQPSNSVVDVNFKLSLIQAIRADKMLRSRPSVSQLLGIPIVLKDIFASVGWGSVAASQVLRGYESPFNSAVAKRCQVLGMVNVGKTNLDEFCMGSTGFKSYYGPIMNSYDARLISGGSSGGSAVAVSMGLAPIAVGSDTGGSVRQPASFSGVVSLKPTYGRISRFGMAAFASSFEQAGIIGHTAKDCSLLLGALAGPDVHDSTASVSLGRNVRSWFGRFSNRVGSWGTCSRPLFSQKFGVLSEHLESAAFSCAIRSLFCNAIKDLVVLGAEVVIVRQLGQLVGVPFNLVYRVITSAEAYSNLLRYNGLRFGRNNKPFGLEVGSRLEAGGKLLAVGSGSCSFHALAHFLREKLFRSFSEVLTNLNFVLCPTSSILPWPASKAGGSFSSSLSDVFTVLVNLMGLPTISLPCGSVGHLGHQLPISFQLVGRPFSESELVWVAHSYQLLTEWPLLVGSDAVF
ncbi:glutamyl-tRNA(Gln) amidotransferase, A subunit [Candidatus Tremblaya phenacola PAVE]|nr:glutamyl-tRNA(Gln) amidotransferase, A subunit [Candidatus Tremblaya phenacola PAVE]